MQIVDHDELSQLQDTRCHGARYAEELFPIRLLLVGRRPLVEQPDFTVLPSKESVLNTRGIIRKNVLATSFR
jgi:hypothetical protein